jgi:hypothetical protein
MKNKFIEAHQFMREGKDIDPPILFQVRISEIKKILPTDSEDWCAFYLYKDEAYYANMSGDELLKLINDD